MPVWTRIWFGDVHKHWRGETKQRRGTEIYKLPSTFRKDLDVTSNIIAECNLSIFNKRAVVAKSRNYKFKDKSIRNDLVLHQPSFENSPSTVLKKIASILNQLEEKWTEEQQKLHKFKMEEKMQKAKNQNQYTQTVDAVQNLEWTCL